MKGSVKNLLSVIAIFAGIAEISGTGVLPFISPENQALYIWFLMSFPFALVLLFFATLNFNHSNLYAPSDYSSDDAFLKGVRPHREERSFAYKLEKELESNIEVALDSLSLNDKEKPLSKEEIADAISHTMRSNSFVRIDARPLTGNESDIYELPYVVFNTMQEFIKEVYFLLSDYVGKFEYGHSWTLRFNSSYKSIESLRLAAGVGRDHKFEDNRSLEEVGIRPGMTLLVTTA